MKKITTGRGFSTAEMLFATMILSLSMMLLAQGALTIQRIYSRTLAATDAQMILSQVETRLRSDLSMATGYKKITNVSGDSISYYYTDSWYRLTTTDNGVLYKEGFLNCPPQDDEEAVKSDQISFKNVSRLENLKIQTTPTIEYDGNCFTVSGLQVQYEDNQGNCIWFPKNPTNPQFVIRALQSVMTGE